MENFDKTKYARIHSIESFGTVDGPGIRFVIFMQGCSLKCKYCHNRDTWDLTGGTITSVDELLDKIERYKAYILPSGGGVTVTGGEPLLQTKFLVTLFKELKKHPFARKIGFSLRIDNIPDSYIHKEEVINLEKQYYLKPAEGGLYRAPIDTTFALYRPRVGLSRSRSVEAYRTAYPYQAEHLPWYNDSSNLSEEEQYYISHCTHITEWSSKSKLDTKTQS